MTINGFVQDFAALSQRIDTIMQKLEQLESEVVGAGAKLLSTKEALQFLGIRSPQTLSKWRAHGLPTITIGRKVFYTHKDLLGFVNQFKTSRSPKNT